MALCAFGSKAAMFDITPVENLFIEEYMRRAPGEYVKVYLYGLMDCYHGGGGDLQDYAKALQLTDEEVQAAFAYWVNMGVVEHSEGGYAYHNLKHLLYNSPQHSMYNYQAFNQDLQRLFPGRALQPSEYQSAYSWMDDLGLSQETVLMMVQYSLQTASNSERLSFKYMDKVALSWSKDGVKTQTDAENYLRERELRYSGAKKVLQHIGVKRLPTKDEHDLMMKWQGWGYDIEAMLAACKELTKIQQPNMAYLDKVMTSYHRLGLTDVMQIRRYQNDREQLQGLMQAIVHELGKREYTPEQQKLYIKWTSQWGFPHEAVLEAAKQTRSFPALDRLLGEWQAQGWMSMQAIARGLQDLQQQDGLVREVLERARVKGQVTDAQRQLYACWTDRWHMPHEVVLLAAEYSVAAAQPLVFLNRILENWQQRDIRSVSVGQADHDARVAGRKGAQDGQGMAKVVDAAKFQQREYTDGDFDYLINE